MLLVTVSLVSGVGVGFNLCAPLVGLLYVEFWRGSMNIFYLLLGGFLLIFTTLDLLWTTLWVDGSAGPISSRLTTLLWHGLRRMGGRNGRTLSLAGPIILAITLFTWVTLIWVGWTFVFASYPGSLVDTSAQEPVTWTGRIWYVAYTMFTVGNGDFRPVGSFWQIASSLTAASGMTFVTLGVSYILSVLGAVSQKRSFASGVTGVGTRSEAIVSSGWNGEHFHAIDLLLSSFATQLGTLVEQHKSYPILHYYHSEQGKDASAMAVTILDEALTILRFGVPEAHRPNAVQIENARSSIQSYLDTLQSAFIQPAKRIPPPPDLDCLRAAGLPTVSNETFAQALASLEERRRMLLGMLEADAWPWPPVKS